MQNSKISCLPLRRIRRHYRILPLFQNALIKLAMENTLVQFSAVFVYCDVRKKRKVKANGPAFGFNAKKKTFIILHYVYIEFFLLLLFLLCTCRRIV